jgi:hypothetical protein
MQSSKQVLVFGPSLKYSDRMWVWEWARWLGSGSKQVDNGWCAD